MMRVGYVGLGDRGGPMARHIVEAGWPVTFFARRPEVIERFARMGARYVPDLRALGQSADLVGVVVVDDDQVRAVVVDGGLLEAMPPGSILVIHSTVHPNTSREIE